MALINGDKYQKNYPELFKNIICHLITVIVDIIWKKNEVKETIKKKAAEIIQTYMARMVCDKCS